LPMAASHIHPTQLMAINPETITKGAA